jgi:hypothetical protein
LEYDPRGSACGQERIDEMMNRVLCVFLFAVAWSASAWRLHADDTPSKQEPASLDQQLLENLDSELLEGLTPPSEPSPPEGRAPPKKIPGEDIGVPDTSADDENPLTRIEQKMRQVEQRLAQRDSSTGTQSLQREIAD